MSCLPTNSFQFNLLPPEIRIAILSYRPIQCITTPICKEWTQTAEQHSSPFLQKWLEKFRRNILKQLKYHPESMLYKQLYDICLYMKGKVVNWNFYRLFMRASHKYFWLRDGDRMINVSHAKLGNLYVVKQITEESRRMLIPCYHYIHMFHHSHNEDKLVDDSTQIGEIRLHKNGPPIVYHAPYSLSFQTDFSLSIGNETDLPECYLDQLELGKNMHFLCVGDNWDISTTLQCLELTPRWIKYAASLKSVISYDKNYYTWLEYCKEEMPSILRNEIFVSMASMGLFIYQIDLQGLRVNYLYGWTSLSIYNHFQTLFSEMIGLNYDLTPHPPGLEKICGFVMVGFPNVVESTLPVRIIKSLTEFCGEPIIPIPIKKKGWCSIAT
jgi:hypothetical protein